MTEKSNMKKPVTADKLQAVARSHHIAHDTRADSREQKEHTHMSMYSRRPLIEDRSPDKSDDLNYKHDADNNGDNSSFSDDDGEDSRELEYSSPNIRKLFPPPNPLPPKALMYLKEPVRLGANTPLMYFYYYFNMQRDVINCIFAFFGIGIGIGVNMMHAIAN